MAQEQWTSEKYQRYLKYIESGLSPNEALAKIDAESGKKTIKYIDTKRKMTEQEIADEYEESPYETREHEYREKYGDLTPRQRYAITKKEIAEKLKETKKFGKALISKERTPEQKEYIKGGLETLGGIAVMSIGGIPRSAEEYARKRSSALARIGKKVKKGIEKREKEAKIKKAREAKEEFEAAKLAAEREHQIRLARAGAPRFGFGGFSAAKKVYKKPIKTPVSLSAPPLPVDFGAPTLSVDFGAPPLPTNGKLRRGSAPSVSLPTGGSDVGDLLGLSSFYRTSKKSKRRKSKKSRKIKKSDPLGLSGYY